MDIWFIQAGPESVKLLKENRLCSYILINYYHIVNYRFDFGNKYNKQIKTSLFTYGMCQFGDHPLKRKRPVFVNVKITGKILIVLFFMYVSS